MSSFPVRLLVSYLKPRKFHLLLLGILILAGIGFNLVNPRIIAYFLDLSQTGGSLRAVYTAAALFIAFSIVQQLIALAARIVSGRVSWYATNQLRYDLTLHCLNLDMAFHKQYTPGEMIERLDGDVHQLGNYFSDFIIQLLGNSLLVTGILVVLFMENPWVGIAMLVYVLLTFLALSLVRKPALRAYTAARQSTAEQYGYIEERISGVEDLRAAGAESYSTHRLLVLMRGFLEKWRFAILMGTITSNLTLILAGSGYAFGMAFGVFLYQNGSVSLGTVYVLIFYIGLLTTPLELIRAQVQDLQQAGASLLRIESLFAQTPSVGSFDGSRQTFTLPSEVGNSAVHVEVEAISFQYPHDAGDESGSDVLENISFTLTAGETLAILGRTGSGKSTLIRLLTRLYEPQQGNITFDDVDLRSIADEHLRQQVGLVSQDVHLFDGSIRDNLSMFDSGFADLDIKSALVKVGLMDWVDAQPGGLDSQLTAGGKGMSAGEAQLLAFARIFLRNPGLVILDEATSRLDLATERKIDSAVSSLLAGRTGIIIAHRLKTIQSVHHVLILEAGKVVEYGTRQELAADDGSLYAHLLKTGLEDVLV